MQTPEDDLRLRSAMYLCRSVLVRLQQLSDADRWQPKVERKSARWAARGIGDPTVQAASKQSAGAPSKQFSLWAHYKHRMQEAADAQDIGMLLTLAACATRDYETRAGSRNRRETDHETLVRQLLLNYQGVSSLEAAWTLGTTEKWVRMQRTLNGRDADHGDEVGGDHLTAKILSMSAAGLSQRQIADEVGLSRGAVRHRLGSA